MIVMKFGGSSVAGAEKIRRVAGIVKARAAPKPAIVAAAFVKARASQKPVIVASAFRGVTDELLALAKDSLKKDKTRLESLRKIHAEAGRELGGSGGPLEPLL